jgi:hypothetical protein
MMALSVFLPKLGVQIDNDALTTTVSVLFTIAGAIWAARRRYRQPVSAVSGTGGQCPVQGAAATVIDRNRLPWRRGSATRARCMKRRKELGSRFRVALLCQAQGA